MAKTYGIINQANEEESRVALTPDVATRLIKAGFDVLIEKGAGKKANFQDEDFEKVGVKVVSETDVLKADYLGFISVPSDDQIKKLSKGQTVIGLFNSFSDESVASKFDKIGVKAVDINKLPRKLSLAQSMDALTSQASVAGYKAVLLAAKEYQGFFPMMTTAAGTIRPASVLVLGAGIAGLAAIGTAKRLGAVVTAFDVREASIEEVESLGAKFLDLGQYGAGQVVAALFSGQGEGGYARALTEDELNMQKNATNKAVQDFDIVITTAQVPGKKPPQFITEEGIKGMKPGSVIIDIAASSLGGNVEGSEPNKTVEKNGVKIIGAPNLASQTSKAASSLLARNIAEVALYFKKSDDGETSGTELKEMVIAPIPSVVSEVPAQAASSIPDVKTEQVSYDTFSQTDTEQETK